MKNKTLWIVLIVILAVLVIGYFTNWFGTKKNIVAVTTPVGSVAVNTPVK